MSKDEKALIAEFEKKCPPDKDGYNHFKHETLKTLFLHMFTDYKNHLEQTWREKVEGLKWNLNNHTHLPPEAHHEASIRNAALDAVLDITNTKV